MLLQCSYKTPVSLVPHTRLNYNLMLQKSELCSQNRQPVKRDFRCLTVAAMAVSAWSNVRYSSHCFLRERKGVLARRREIYCVVEARHSVGWKVVPPMKTDLPHLHHLLN